MATKSKNKFTTLPPKEVSVRGELYDTIRERMASSEQVMSLKDAAEYVPDIERKHGVILSDRAILLTYWDAVDSLIDSMVNNARETTDNPDFDSEKVTREWEAMRPTAIRRKELTAKFGAE